MKLHERIGRKTLPVPSNGINKEKCKRRQELNLNTKEFAGIKN